ncbi:MAG: tRNA-dihydrouridine synthase [bacterium]
MDFDEIRRRLKGGLFLSSMMSWCDAEFCAARARGCDMVQLGAFVLRDDRETADWRHPEPEPGAVTAHLRAQFDACRSKAADVSGADNVPVISANIFPVTDRHLALSAAAFVDAGGDIYELNAHGGIGSDRELGTGRMLFLPEHKPKLFRWAQMLVDAGGPVIIKARRGIIPDLTEHVRHFEQTGVHAFHVNVRGETEGEQDVGLLERVRGATDMLLLASGYVTDGASARRLFDAGADAVGIAQGAVDNPDIFADVSAELG